MLQEYQTLPSNIKTSPIQSFMLQEYQTLPSITKTSPIPSLMLQEHQTLPSITKSITNSNSHVTRIPNTS